MRSQSVVKSVCHAPVVSQSVSCAVNHLQSQTVGQLRIAESGSQLVPQQVSHAARQLCSQSVALSVSPRVSQSHSHSVAQLVRCAVSQSHSHLVTQSVNFAVMQSVS